MADPKYATASNAAEGRISPTGVDLNTFIDQAPDGMLTTQGALPPLPAKVSKNEALARRAAIPVSDESDDSADDEYADMMQTEKDGVVPRRVQLADAIDLLDDEQRGAFHGLPITEDPAVPHVVPAPINHKDEPMVFSPAGIFCSVKAPNGAYNCTDFIALQGSSIQKPLTRFTAPKHVDGMQEPAGPATEADVAADVVFTSKCEVYIPTGAKHPRIARATVGKDHYFFSLTRHDEGADLNTTQNGIKVLVKEVEPDSDDNEIQVWKYPDTKPSKEILAVAAEQVLGMVTDAYHKHGINLVVHVYKGKNTALADSVFGRAIEFVQRMASATQNVTVLAGVQLNDQCMPTEAMATKTQPMAMAVLWQMAVRCAPKGEAMEHYERLMELLEGEDYPRVGSLLESRDLLENCPTEFAKKCRDTFNIIAGNLKSPVVPDAFMAKIKLYCNALITAADIKIQRITEFFQEKIWDIVDGVGHFIKYKRCLAKIEMLEDAQRQMLEAAEEDAELMDEMQAIAAPPVVDPKVKVDPKLAEWLDDAPPQLITRITQFVVDNAPTNNGKRDGLVDATTQLGDGSDWSKFEEFVQSLAAWFGEWMEHKLSTSERELVILRLRENQDGTIGGRRSRLVATIMKPLIDAAAADEQQALEAAVQAAKLKAANVKKGYTPRRSRRTCGAPKRLIQDDTNNQQAKRPRVN